MIRIPPHIVSLQPYVAGKPISELARERKLSRIVKLASNENPHGPSPKAMEAAIRTIAENHRYVDPGAHDLVGKIAQYYRIPAERIVCGAGVDSLLGYIIDAFTARGDEVLTSEGTFIGIYVNTRKRDRVIKTVPLRNYHFDLDALALTISDRTRIIYLANPNNPTGTIFSRDEFENFMQKVPTDVLVILDEAYFSYAQTIPDYPNGLSYDHVNLIVTRTFSKDYGLAGFRVGFASAQPALIRELYKVKLPFEPSYPAQQAAIAALDDNAFLEMTVAVNDRNLTRMSRRFTELGLTQVPSSANFILLTLPSKEIAMRFYDACLAQGLIVRPVASFGIANGIRINTGTDDETGFALKVIERVVISSDLTENHLTPSLKR